MLRSDRDNAIILAIKGRFYAGKSKTGRLQTAWSVAGAETFGPWQEREIENAERFIQAKGRSSIRMTLALQTAVREEP